jgi:MFS family permease
MTDTTTHLHRRVHALRRVSSIPFLVIGAAVVLTSILTSSPLPIGGRVSGSVALILAAIALWLALRIVLARKGIGMGRERIGLIALIASIVAIFPVVPLLLGPAFLLGALLFAVGWRLEDRRQWITGALVAVLSIPLSFFLLENLVAPYGRFITGDPLIRPSADDIVLMLVGLAVVGIGVLAWREEDRITRTPRA